MNMTRPDLDGKCPDQRVPCNPNGNRNNMICIETEDPEKKGRTVEERCPITEIEFKLKKD